MKTGACLLNASRGTVVDIPALAEALRASTSPARRSTSTPRSRRPTATASDTGCSGLPNVILTPHIGGSTEEAQEAIGREVATSLIKFVNTGADHRRGELPAGRAAPDRAGHATASSTSTATCPACCATSTGSSRTCNANIHAQMLATDADIGYLIMDLD